MKHLICTVVMALAAVVACAEENTHLVKHIDKEKFARLMYRKNGGKLKVPGVQKGALVYVNAQQLVSKESLEKQAAVFAEAAKIEVKVVDGKFDLAHPEIVGDATLFIVADDKLPSLLIAPEQKWAMVNLAPLRNGRGAKDVFFNARIQKELARADAMLCGAACSNYPDSLTGCVTNADQLDKFKDANVPVDVIGRFKDYLKGYGIGPYKLATYRQACKEGWAPAPKDDIQKAIWDEYHTIPTEGMKIEFDPAKGK